MDCKITHVTASDRVATTEHTFEKLPQRPQWINKLLSDKSTKNNFATNSSINMNSSTDGFPFISIPLYGKQRSMF